MTHPEPLEPPVDNYLETWDTLRHAIDKAHSLLDLKSIRVQAEAYRYALKLAGEAPEVVRKACQIKLRAERRAGQLLLETPKQAPGEYQRSQAATVASYAELDIDKRDASKWQRIASIPDVEFETWMTTAQDITTSGALQVARLHQREKDSFFRKVSVFRVVTGKYAVVLADPPWSYDDKSDKENRWGGAESHYTTLSTDDLCSFRLQIGSESVSVPDMVEDDSLLFLWTTAPMLPDALKVMAAWGFEYRTVAFTWIKRNNDGSPFIGLGNYTRSNAEYCLLGVKGKGVSVEHHGISSVVETMRLEHSEKPAEIRPRIISLVGDVPRIELFARHRVRGWDCYGDQVED